MSTYSRVQNRILKIPACFQSQVCPTECDYSGYEGDDADDKACACSCFGQSMSSVGAGEDVFVCLLCDCEARDARVLFARKHVLTRSLNSTATGVFMATLTRKI